MACSYEEHAITRKPRWSGSNSSSSIASMIELVLPAPGVETVSARLHCAADWIFPARMKSGTEASLLGHPGRRRLSPQGDDGLWSESNSSGFSELYHSSASWN